MSLIETAGLLFGVVSKFMDKTPNYDQKKKQEYYDLKKEYDEQVKKDFPDRDDELISMLRDELRVLSQVFYEEISR